MLGPPKSRRLSEPVAASLEDLVPTDHFYRYLERTLDLAFVRDLVRDAYASNGRPSLDPVVFFKLQLILFFEGLRSERQLMRVVADRLSLRWCLGYGLTEALPGHSSLTRVRERYGLEPFRRFFETVVEQCVAAGLVWGEELYIDSTDVEANAAADSLQPRFAVEAHLGRLLRMLPCATAVAAAETACPRRHPCRSRSRTRRAPTSPSAPPSGTNGSGKRDGPIARKRAAPIDGRPTIEPVQPIQMRRHFGQTESGHVSAITIISSFMAARPGSF